MGAHAGENGCFEIGGGLDAVERCADLSIECLLRLKPREQFGSVLLSSLRASAMSGSLRSSLVVGTAELENVLCFFAVHGLKGVCPKFRSLYV